MRIGTHLDGDNITGPKAATIRAGLGLDFHGNEPIRVEWFDNGILASVDAKQGRHRITICKNGVVEWGIEKRKGTVKTVWKLSESGTVSFSKQGKLKKPVIGQQINSQVQQKRHRITQAARAVTEAMGYPVSFYEPADKVKFVPRPFDLFNGGLSRLKIWLFPSNPQTRTSQPNLRVAYSAPGCR